MFTDKKRFPHKRRIIQKIKICFFCNEKKIPSLKELETLRRCLNDRGKILSRERTGLCRKHQKKVAQEIKRARLLSLFPFVSKIR